MLTNKITKRSIGRIAKKLGRDWKWRFWPFLRTRKESQPAQDQKTYAVEEQSLLTAAQNDMQKITIEMERTDRQIRPKCEQLYARIQSLLVRLPKIESAAAEAKTESETAKANLAAFLPPAVKPFWVFFWLAFLGLAEFPLTTTVFALLAESTILTVLMASIVWAVPLWAHFLGQGLKQRRKEPHDWYFLIGIPILVVGSLICFGLLRGAYLSAALSRLTSIKIGVSPALGTAIFMILNLLIFGVATGISYFGAHPEHREYRNAIRRFRNAKKEYKLRSSEASKIMLQLEGACEALAEAEQQRQAVWREHREKARHISDNGAFLSSHFRTVNMLHRPSAVQPECFILPLLRAELPPSLTAPLEGNYPLPAVQKTPVAPPGKGLVVAGLFLLAMSLSLGAAVRPAPPKVVDVLFDLSESTNRPQKREAMLAAFNEILEHVTPGDAIIGSIISAQSVSEPAFLLKEEFPVFTSSLSGILKAAEKEDASARFKVKLASLKNVAAHALKGPQRSILRTDILSALQVAERVLSDFPQPRKVLVILSDMIEDSTAYNFETEILSDKRIGGILANEKQLGRLPDLRGVHVYVAGATAANLDQYYSVQKFWLSYFKECGTVIQKKDYGSLLLSFPE